MKRIMLAMMLVVGMVNVSAAKNELDIEQCSKMFTSDLCANINHVIELGGKDRSENKKWLEGCLPTNPNPQKLLSSCQEPLDIYANAAKNFQPLIIKIIQEMPKGKDQINYRMASVLVLETYINTLYETRDKWIQCLCSNQCRPFCGMKKSSVITQEDPQITQMRQLEENIKSWTRKCRQLSIVNGERLSHIYNNCMVGSEPMKKELRTLRESSVPKKNIQNYQQKTLRITRACKRARQDCSQQDMLDQYEPQIEYWKKECKQIAEFKAQYDACYEASAGQVESIVRDLKDTERQCSCASGCNADW